MAATPSFQSVLTQLASQQTDPVLQQLYGNIANPTGEVDSGPYGNLPQILQGEQFSQSVLNDTANNTGSPIWLNGGSINPNTGANSGNEITPGNPYYSYFQAIENQFPNAVTNSNGFNDLSINPGSIGEQPTWTPGGVDISPTVLNPATLWDTAHGNQGGSAGYVTPASGQTELDAVNAQLSNAQANTVSTINDQSKQIQEDQGFFHNPLNLFDIAASFIPGVGPVVAGISGAAQGAESGNPLQIGLGGLSAVGGGLGVAGSLSGDQTLDALGNPAVDSAGNAVLAPNTLSTDLTEAGKAASIAGKAASLGNSISQGDTAGAITSGVGLGQGVYDVTSPSTSSTTPTTSSTITPNSSSTVQGGTEMSDSTNVDTGNIDTGSSFWSNLNPFSNNFLGGAFNSSASGGTGASNPAAVTSTPLSNPGSSVSISAPGTTASQISGAGGGTAGGSAAGGNSFMNFLNNPSFGSFTDFLGKNASALVPAGALAFNAIQGQQQPKGTGALGTEASTLSAQGNQLQSYLTSGTLPPGVQAGLDQAAEQAKAQIRSQYASKGMSGSSAEAADLANVDQQIQAQGANIAMNLLNQGVSESGLAANIYQQLVQNTMTQDQQMQQLFSNFGNALGGGSGSPNTLTIKTS